MNENTVKEKLGDYAPEYSAFAKCVTGLGDEFADRICEQAGWLAECSQDLCQSEIEKLLFVAYALRLKMYKCFGSAHGGDAYYFTPAPNHLSPDLEKFPMPYGIGQFDVLFTQYQVGTYRADILVKRWVKEGNGSLVTPSIVVECDGHDFHERTKEQAAHDKKRDRFMQTEGYQVLRFTGSEIFRDPAGCAKQIDECLDQHISRECIKQRAARQATEKVGAV